MESLLAYGMANEYETEFWVLLGSSPIFLRVLSNIYLPLRSEYGVRPIFPISPSSRLPAPHLPSIPHHIACFNWKLRMYSL